MSLNIVLLCNTEDQLCDEFELFRIFNAEDIELFKTLDTPIPQRHLRMYLKDGTVITGVCRSLAHRLHGMKIHQAIIAFGVDLDLIDLVRERMTDDVPEEFLFQYIHRT